MIESAKPKTSLPQLLSAGAMEICWLYAWAEFVLYSAFKLHVSLMFVVTLFAVGAIVKKVILGRLRIRLLVYLANLLCFSAALYVAVRLFLIRSNENLKLFNGADSLFGNLDIMSLLLIGAVVVFTVVIWLRSRYHVSTNLDLNQLYNCYDGAMAAFVALMVFKLMGQARFGVSLDQPSLIPLYLPMFMLGASMLGIHLSRTSNETRYFSGIQKLGVAISFAAVILVTAFSVVTLTRSQLTDTAVAFSKVAKSGGRTFLDFITWLIQATSGRERAVAPASSSPDVDMPDVSGVAHQGSIWFEISKWVIIVLAIFVALVLVYSILKLLLRFLLTRVEPSRTSDFSLRQILRWLARVFRKALNIIKRVISSARGIRTYEDLYKWLIAWGRRSGIPKSKSDTLLEFQIRLSKRFPELAGQTRVMVDLIYEDIYREHGVQSANFQMARKASRQMRHPRFWPCRLKNWLF